MKYLLLYESLPRENSVKQLKKIRKLTKGIDIGDKLVNNYANLQWDRNPIDTVESYEDYIKSNKGKPFKNKN